MVPYNFWPKWLGNNLMWDIPCSLGGPSKCRFILSAGGCWVTHRGRLRVLPPFCISNIKPKSYKFRKKLPTKWDRSIMQLFLDILANTTVLNLVSQFIIVFVKRNTWYLDSVRFYTWKPSLPFVHSQGQIHRLRNWLFFTRLKRLPLSRLGWGEGGREGGEGPMFLKPVFALFVRT